MINPPLARQIILDTETTGMNRNGLPHLGHRIIEIGGIEVINRRLTGNNFHIYLKPDRLVSPGAFHVHGIADEFLLDKPDFSLIADDFIDYIRGAELVIHNASFDIGFIDQELSKLNRAIPKTNSFCKIIDTLALARKIFPGKRNRLDDLCKRYDIDNSKRTLHGALLDAQILADVYLAMTGGQTLMAFASESDNTADHGQQKARHPQLTPATTTTDTRIDRNHIGPLHIIKASDAELLAHQQLLEKLKQPGW